MSSIMREDWIEVELGEICFTTSGGTPSRNNFEYYQGLIPWVKSGELDKGIIYDTEEHISEEAVKKSSAKIFPKGSLLIALYGATIGKLAFLGVEATTNQAICGIYKNDFIDSKYLYNFLLNKKQKLISQGTGGAQPNISQTILKKLEIPLAPLPIQRAIVSKIETLFSDLDNGIANFKKAQAQLKIYRQAVLKKAFEGELTAAWREKQTNLPIAEELLQQIKEERQNHYNQQIEDWKKAVKEWEKMGKKGIKPSKPTQQKELAPLKKEELEELSKLPTGWKWEKIGLNFLNLDQGWSPKCENYPANIGEWGVIKTTAVQANSFEEINNKKLPQKLNPRIQHELAKGDILITRAGPRNRVGICCLVNNVRSKLINCDKVYRIKAILSNPSFIVYMLNSPAFLKELEKTKSGISDSGVNLKQDVFLKMPIPLCSLQEQTQIVQEIEHRLSVCDKVEQSLIESIEKAEALRQSILKKAFEGKLLSKAEIEQCKKEADYEPASELLKKIQAERLAKEQEKKNKKTPTFKKKSKN